MLVSVDGVVQEPSVAYAVSSGTTLTFTAAPSNNAGNNIFVYYLASQVGTVGHPSNQALSATNGTFTGAITGGGVLTTGGNIVIPNAGNIGSASDVDAMTISSGGVVTFSQNTVGAGAMHHILTTDVSAGDASVIFNSTYITTTYRSYKVIISGYEPVTDQTALRLHPSIDNGSNFVAGITKGQHFLRVNNTSGNGYEVEGSDGYFGVGGASLGNDDNETASFIVNLTGLTSAVHKKYISYENVGKHSTQAYRWAGGAIIPTTSAINYIKFAPSSGNITAGRFSLYGIES